MRKRNSAIMIGSVKLKSKREAFSISSASEGGAMANELARMTEMDLRVDGIERVSRDLGDLGRGSFGKGIWVRESLNLGDGGMVKDEEVIKTLEELIIMLAMASSSFSFSLLLQLGILQL